jgi:hypothetical protein
MIRDQNNNYLFSRKDLERTKIKKWQYLLLLVLPTYYQCSDGYVWFYKIWKEKIYLMGEEQYFNERK